MKIGNLQRALVLNRDTHSGPELMYKTGGRWKVASGGSDGIHRLVSTISPLLAIPESSASDGCPDKQITNT